MSTISRSLKYGRNSLWVTPVKLLNLLELGVVENRLHEWLEDYANSPHLLMRPFSEWAAIKDKKAFTRQDLSIFASPPHPEISEIADILLDQAEQYAREAFVDPLPEHERTAFMWFVVNRPNNEEDAARPHGHEASDVAFVYYLTVATDNSGTLVLLDPRGCTDRGGLVLPTRHICIPYTPKRGDLIIFPRYVGHYSTMNTGTGLRKLIGGVVGYSLPSEEVQKFNIKSSKDRAKKADAVME